MNTLKRTCIFFLTAFLLVGSLSLQAQSDQQQEKKITIIKEYTDQNGNKVVEKTIKQGDQVEHNVEVDDVNVSTNISSLSDLQRFNFKSIDELKDIDLDLDINELKLDGNKDFFLRLKKDGGDLETFEWKNGDMPKELQEKLEDFNIKFHSEGDEARTFWFENGNKNARFKFECDSDKPFLGITMGKTVTNENGVETTQFESDKGVPIMSVVNGGAAEAAGLQKGDIISDFNGQSVRSIDDLTDAIQAAKIGDNVRVSYLRNGQFYNTNVTLQKRTSPRFDLQEKDFKKSYFRFNENKQERPCVFIGVQIGTFLDAANDESGVEVIKVLEDTPAFISNLQEGDIITAVNNVEVNTHKDLLTERNKYNPGDKVVLSYLRNGLISNTDIQFKECEENKKRNSMVIIKRFEDNTNVDDEEETPVNRSPAITYDNSLALDNFRAFPNPAQGQINVRFEAEANPVLVKVLDIDGKELYREDVANFDGTYGKRIDLSNAPKGTLLLTITQGDKVFTEKIINNTDSQGLRP